MLVAFLMLPNAAHVVDEDKLIGVLRLLTDAYVAAYLYERQVYICVILHIGGEDSSWCNQQDHEFRCHARLDLPWAARTI